MSSKRNRSKAEKNKFVQVVLLALAAFGIGYYLLNYVATWENPVLGNTFYIVSGCILIAASVIVLLAAIKYRYFPKKKKKASKPIFLNDQHKEHHS